MMSEVLNNTRAAAEVLSQRSGDASLGDYFYSSLTSLVESCEKHKAELDKGDLHAAATRSHDDAETLVLIEAALHKSFDQVYELLLTHRIVNGLIQASVRAMDDKMKDHPVTDMSENFAEAAQIKDAALEAYTRRLLDDMHAILSTSPEDLLAKYLPKAKERKAASPDKECDCENCVTMRRWGNDEIKGDEFVRRLIGDLIEEGDADRVHEAVGSMVTATSTRAPHPVSGKILTMEELITGLATLGIEAGTFMHEDSPTFGMRYPLAIHEKLSLEINEETDRVFNEHFGPRKDTPERMH